MLSISTTFWGYFKRINLFGKYLIISEFIETIPNTCKTPSKFKVLLGTVCHWTFTLSLRCRQMRCGYFFFANEGPGAERSKIIFQGSQRKSTDLNRSLLPFPALNHLSRPLQNVLRALYRWCKKIPHRGGFRNLTLILQRWALKNKMQTFCLTDLKMQNRYQKEPILFPLKTFPLLVIYTQIKMKGNKRKLWESGNLSEI